MSIRRVDAERLAIFDSLFRSSVPGLQGIGIGTVTTGEPGTNVEVSVVSQEDEQAAPQVYREATAGDIVTFTDGADDVAMKSVVVNVTLSQGGSGDASPSNIRPITGWSGVNICDSKGVNFLPTSMPANAISGTVKSNTDYITTSSAGWCFAVPVPRNTNLYVQKLSTDRGSSGFAFCKTGDIALNTPIYEYKGFTNATGYAINTGEYPWMVFSGASKSDTEDFFTSRELMISIGNSRKDYVSPKGQVNNYVSWQTEAGEIAAGYVDVTKGKLVVEWKLEDLGNLSWYNATAAASTFSDLGGVADGYTGTTTLGNLKAEQAVVLALGDFNNMSGVAGQFISFNSQNRLYYMSPDISGMTGAQIKSHLAGRKVAYKLANPIVYDITQATINTLLGNNNVYANCGSIQELIYPVDAKTYLDSIFGIGKDLSLNITIPRGEDGTVTQEQMDELEAVVDTKADIDGSYDTLTAGNAEQLVATSGQNDSSRYMMRKTIGNGDRKTMELVGGSVVWNQLVDFKASTTVLDVTISCTNGLLTISGTASGNGGRLVSIVDTNIPLDANHNYFVLTTMSLSAPQFYLTKVGDTSKTVTLSTSRIIFKPTESGNYILGVNMYSGTAYSASGYLGIVDLTQMFGSTIADYIYGLESATTGAGIAWLKANFPGRFDSYHPYTTGEFVHVGNLVSHDTIGFNQWDGQYESGYIDTSTGENKQSSLYSRVKGYIQVIPGESYYINYADSWKRFVWYDANKNFVSYSQNNSNQPETAPDNAFYLRVYWNASNNPNPETICINISDTSLNGTYQPYEKHSYPLDSEVELRGVLKLDSNNQLYYDGDVYPSSGNIERRFVEDEISIYQIYTRSGNENVKFALFKLSNKFVSTSEFISNKDISRSTAGWSETETGKLVVYDTPTMVWAVSVPYDYTLQQAQSLYADGVIVYQIPESIIEQATPFAENMVVDPTGTEQFVIDSEAPMIPYQNSTYFPNLRERIEGTPDVPTTNGDYILRRANGSNSYAALEKELPTAPTTNGEYYLKCAVSSGAASYSWEEEGT